MNKTFQVNLTVTEERIYCVNANSPEEAEGIVEAWYADGERGASGEVLDLQAEAFEVEENAVEG